MGASEAGPLWVEDWTNNHRVKKPIGEAAQLGEVVHAEAIAHLTLVKRSWAYSPTHPRPSVVTLWLGAPSYFPRWVQGCRKHSLGHPSPFRCLAARLLMSFVCSALRCCSSACQGWVAAPVLSPTACVLRAPLACCLPLLFSLLFPPLFVVADCPCALPLPSPFSLPLRGLVCLCACVCACNLLQYHKRKRIKAFKYMQGGLVVRASASSTKGFACM